MKYTIKMRWAAVVGAAMVSFALGCEGGPGSIDKIDGPFEGAPSSNDAPSNAGPVNGGTDRKSVV